MLIHPHCLNRSEKYVISKARFGGNLRHLQASTLESLARKTSALEKHSLVKLFTFIYVITVAAILMSPQSPAQTGLGGINSSSLAIHQNTGSFIAIEGSVSGPEALPSKAPRGRYF